MTAAVALFAFMQELAHGRPPMARLHPMRILSDTIRNPAPELEDRADGLPFSKVGRQAFKDQRQCAGTFWRAC